LLTCVVMPLERRTLMPASNSGQKLLKPTLLEGLV
jgi:hypothetical protein